MLEQEEAIPYQEPSLSDFAASLILFIFAAFALGLFYVALGGIGVLAGVIIVATLYLGSKLDQIIKLLKENTISDLEPLK